MAIRWTQEEVDRTLKMIRKKSMTDKAFRALLISDPHKAIKQATGTEVPPGFKIKVVESDPAYHMTFALPEMITDELSDEALEKAAGGAFACVIGGVAGGQACAAAVNFGPCGADACAAEGNVGGARRG